MNGRVQGRSPYVRNSRVYSASDQFTRLNRVLSKLRCLPVSRKSAVKTGRRSRPVEQNEEKHRWQVDD
jgi:hypothetical protein